MKNILVTGPCGYLGMHLVKRLMQLKKYNVFLLVEEINNVSSIPFRPDIILHLASKLPSHEGDTYNINFNATKKLVSLCDDNTHFVFMSSDYVFEGNTHTSYSEKDFCVPTTEYGKSKLACENYLSQNLKKVTILRTSMLYGYNNPRRKNFVQLLFSSLENNQHVDLFTDVHCRPTHVNDLCDFIFNIMEKEKTGIFHACSEDYINRFDLALAFCLANHFNPNLLCSTTKKAGQQLPLSLNLQPSREFLKLSKTHLKDGLKYSTIEV